MTDVAPTRRQYHITREVTRWYLQRYFGTQYDIGVPRMFCDESRVGHFSVNAESLAAGDSAALFRLLVTMTMFQRRSDAQIMRVLRGILREDAIEMTDADRLIALARDVGCEHLDTTATLRERCDLAKDSATKCGVCGQRPDADCHLKRHTVLLKRYGHFGKVPSSAALMLRDNGVDSMSALKDDIWARCDSPSARAVHLENAVTAAWRVSEKIAAMFLSAVTNPDLSDRAAPWANGVDWTEFVVIDSNVDLYLKAIGYGGAWTYRARKAFVRRLAVRIRLDELQSSLTRFNPRLVQQALYMFMSVSNRRDSLVDCGQRGWSACDACPKVVAAICGRRSKRGQKKGARAERGEYDHSIAGDLNTNSRAAEV